MTTVTFSADATLRVCERRWFFNSLVAHPTAKKEWIRREAHVLRQLTHPPAWAGKIIHTTIEDVVLPAVRAGHLPDVDAALAYARTLLKQQAEFSQKRRYRQTSKTKAGRDFCALFVDEYEDGLTQSQLEDTEWRVATALTNIPNMRDLWTSVQGAGQCFVEHSFRVRLEAALLEAKPDLVLLSGRRVIIVDWKSWTSFTADPGDQLRFYAHVLRQYWSRRGLKAQDFALLSVNLLRGTKTFVPCTEQDLNSAEDRIVEFLERSGSLLRDRSWSDIPVYTLGTPRSPETCDHCKFRSICRDAVPPAQEGELWAAAF
jgi:hypothetical protein